MPKKKFILPILLALFLGLTIGVFPPKTAQAQNVNELLAQIQKLQAQIQALQQRLAELQGRPQRWCHDFNRDLKYGNAGSEVRALQIVLKNEGFYKREITGNFDQYTASAVVGFQEKYKEDILAPWGLEHGTGFVGKTTRAKLNELYGCGGVQPPPTKPYIQVLSPNGGETWVMGIPQTINWHSVGINNNVAIYLQFSDGAMCKLAEEPASRGKYTVILQENRGCLNIARNITPGKYKVSIWSIDKPSIHDSSDNYFSIVKAGTPSITVLSPNGGERWEIGETHRIRLQRLGGEPWKDVYNIVLVDKKGDDIGLISCHNPLLEAETEIEWDTHIVAQCCGAGCPEKKIEVGQYKIRVLNSARDVIDESDNYFSIVEAGPKITILSPQTGDTLIVGSPVTIGWQTESLTSGKLYLFYHVDGYGPYYWNYITALPLTSTSYTWTVPDKPGKASIWIGVWTVKNGVGQWAVSRTVDNLQIIKREAPYIKVLSPNGGEVWVVGNTYKVRWDSQGIDKVKIYVFNPNISGSGSTNYIVPNNQAVPASKGYYDWTIGEVGLPPGVGEGAVYKIRIVDVDSNLSDESDDYFSIVSATTTACTDSDGGKNYYVKGEVTQKEAGHQTTLVDFCIDEKTLNEGFCENGSIQAIKYECPGGCKDGKCVGVSLACDSYGDMDNDGYITKKDVDILFDLIGKTVTEEQKRRGDVNGNGGLDFDDVAKLNSYLEGEIDTLPVCEEAGVGLKLSKDQLLASISAIASQISKVLERLREWIGR